MAQGREMYTRPGYKKPLPPAIDVKISPQDDNSLNRAFFYLTHGHVDNPGKSRLASTTLIEAMKNHAEFERKR